MGLNAPSSNRLVGERMVKDEVEWLGRKGIELLEEYDRLRPSHNYTTFADVERIWQDVVAPKLPEFISMQEKWEGQEDLPGDSPWRKNKTVRF
jgi:hypothetical protein